MRYLGVTALVAAAWVALCSFIIPVRAQQMPCFDKFSPEQWTARTAEVEFWHGITTSGILTRLFMNPKGEFTVIMDMGQGKVCIPVVGGDAEFVVPKSMGSPS